MTKQTTFKPATKQQRWPKYIDTNMRMGENGHSPMLSCKLRATRNTPLNLDKKVRRSVELHCHIALVFDGHADKVSPAVGEAVAVGVDEVEAAELLGAIVVGVDVNGEDGSVADRGKVGGVGEVAHLQRKTKARRIVNRWWMLFK